MTMKSDHLTTESGHLKCLRCGVDTDDGGLCVSCENLFLRTKITVKRPPTFTAPVLDPPAAVRTFASGATRDTDTGKPDYDGYLHPLTVKRFGAYMLKHQTLRDGSQRSSSNWTKGIERSAYVSSLMRHVEDVRRHQHGYPEAAVEPMEEALCAVLFNAQGLLLEVLLERDVK